MSEQFAFNIESFVSLHRFGNILNRAMYTIDDAQLIVTPKPEAKDSIGKHWYGSRLSVVDKLSGRSFYFHVGLIYLPETETGLMVELDEKNNIDCYKTVWQNVVSGNTFNVNKVEQEYLKLFYKAEMFENLYGKNANEQVKQIANYLHEGVRAIVDAANLNKEQGFVLNENDLNNSYLTALAFETSAKSVSPTDFKITIDYNAENFGQYAQGYRLFVTNEKISMYIYFGAIYSYKKDPKGIFAEIDKSNNEPFYDKIFKDMAQNDAYELSVAEPAFVKLFMTQEDTKRLNNMTTAENQIAFLGAFLNKCCEEMFKGYDK